MRETSAAAAVRFPGVCHWLITDADRHAIAIIGIRRFVASFRD